MAHPGSRRLPGWLKPVTTLLPLPAVLISLAACSALRPRQSARVVPQNDQTTPLPEPRLQGPLSLEETVTDRRSIRKFSDQPVDLAQISQLLWAAQGITDLRGFRTAPSAGALYPLEVYLLTAGGVFQYQPEGHSITLIDAVDQRVALARAALGQTPLTEAPLVLVITAVYERTQGKYGAERSPRYVHMEAGHAAQNVLLQAVSLDLGTVPIGAFHDREVQAVLSLPADHMPLYLIPVGHPR